MPCCVPGHDEMERLKRRLDRVPSLLGAAERVLLCGLPAADDVEGALRAEGVMALLSAHGLRIQESLHAGRATAAIWLGGDPLALRGLDMAEHILLWPAADAPVETLDAAMALADPFRLILASHAQVPIPGLRTELLPEPAHALWGLLDHHPRGTGVLDLRAGRVWADLLPPARLSFARRVEWLPRGAGLRTARRLARRRLVEAARRILTAHAEVETDRVGTSVFAALLGRRIRGHGAAVEGYWRAWSPAPVRTKQAA